MWLIWFLRIDVYAETHVRSCNGAAVTFTGLPALLPTNSTSEAATELKVLTDNSGGEYLVADLQWLKQPLKRSGELSRNRPVDSGLME
ncbi:MAG TPA: hypothetical protein VI653_01175 [Steroidobacteraceae bacterium]